MGKKVNEPGLIKEKKAKEKKAIKGTKKIQEAKQIKEVVSRISRRKRRKKVPCCSASGIRLPFAFWYPLYL